MRQQTYREKLRRQFARYLFIISLVFFAVFTLVLLAYTVGYSYYMAGRHNASLSQAFGATCDSYTRFLRSEDTRDHLLRRLSGEASDKYTAYYFNSFNLATGMEAGVVLSSPEGEPVFTTFGAEAFGPHMRLFDSLVQSKLAAEAGPLYHTVYHLNGDSGRFVFAGVLTGEDGARLGGFSLYLDGAGWDRQMRQQQYDGIITDAQGNVVAASNPAMVDGRNRFAPENRHSYTMNGQSYWMQQSYLPAYGVYVYTLVSSTVPFSFLAITLVTLAVLLGVLFLSGRGFAGRIADQSTAALKTLHDEISIVQGGAVDHRIRVDSGDEFEDIAHHINTTLDSVNALALRNIELVTLKNTMERKQLEAQFNPHFLYNTLESIRYTIRFAPADADAIILRLTALLRYSISSDQAQVPLRADLDHLRDYLAIIQYRFSDRFEYRLDIDPACLSKTCPKLLLQPLVENSVKYGLQQKSHLTVVITGWLEGNDLCLRVADDGVDMDAAVLDEMRQIIEAPEGSAHHKGLQNVARRLKLQYGGRSGLTLAAGAAGGLKVTLRVAGKEEGAP
ncbi:sensor histidine kinase [Ruminococcaceae bacterium OttesenSCG-928-D13]|nr:sensor histidine kinase [Ruminococcaceae bacterium OttesenSCG-928-D13]